jgi:hypothetical protein
MSGILELKEWYSLEAAARRLTTKFNEQITDGDVIHLALAGKLFLSWNAVNKFACRVVPITALINTVGGEGSPNWAEFEGDVRWDCGYAHRTNKTTRIREPFASLKCVSDDYTPKTLVSGLFRFHPEYSDTWAWLSSPGKFIDGGGGGWNLSGGVYLSDDLGQMWNFLDRPELLRHPGESLSKLEARLDRLGDLPRHSQIIVQRSDVESFETTLESAATNQERLPRSPTHNSSSAWSREKNNLLRTIGLMINHRYTKDIEAPYTIASLLIEKAKELDVKTISDGTIASHIKAALDLLKGEKT